MGALEKRKAGGTGFLMEMKEGNLHRHVKGCLFGEQEGGEHPKGDQKGITGEKVA